MTRSSTEVRFSVADTLDSKPTPQTASVTFYAEGEGNPRGSRQVADPEALVRLLESLLSGQHARITVRALIGLWGARSRAYWYVHEIKSSLARAGFQTDPPFDEVAIDDEVRFVQQGLASNQTPRRQDGVSSSGSEGPVEREADLAEPGRGVLRAKELASKPAKLIGVRPNDSLVKAQSLMMRHDYSQLAVKRSKHELKGAISWESIAKATMHTSSVSLLDCVVEAHVIDEREDLLSHVPRIISAGYVFVRDRRHEVYGIVTTADLSSQFFQLAAPFILIEAVEQKLRVIARENFAAEDFVHAAGRDIVAGPAVDVDQLTLGQLARLFTDGDLWARLSWNIDHTVFNQLLETVVQYRNSVMHFRKVDSHEGVESVQRLNAWLEVLRK
jgi:predicted transcriptional regulator